MISSKIRRATAFRSSAMTGSFLAVSRQRRAPALLGSASASLGCGHEDVKLPRRYDSAPPGPGAGGTSGCRPHPLRRLVAMPSPQELVATSVHAAGADDVRAGGAGEHAAAAGDRDPCPRGHGIVAAAAEGTFGEGTFGKRMVRSLMSHQGAGASDRVAHPRPDPQLERAAELWWWEIVQDPPVPGSWAMPSYSSTETSRPPACGISSSFMAATVSALARSSFSVMYRATARTFPGFGAPSQELAQQPRSSRALGDAL